MNISFLLLSYHSSYFNTHLKTNLEPFTPPQRPQINFPTMAIADDSQAKPSASQGPSDDREEEIKSGSFSPNSNSSVGSDSGGDPTSFRTQVGDRLSSLTDVVNENLIIVRYATFSTVFLLGAYGIANTPLFYRYKNLNDIANKVFTKRRRIHGRLVGVLDSTNNIALSSRQFASTSSQSSEHWNDAAAISSSVLHPNGGNDYTQTQQQQKPITVLFRHSSPMERLLTQSAMERILQFTTAREESTSLLYSSSNTHRNLLPIELAGIVSPPTIAPTNHRHSSVLSATLTNGSSTSSSTQSSSLVPEVLQSLIEKKTRVSLQMLALRTAPSTNNNGTKKSTSPSMMDESNIHSAICHLHYRKPNQWFSTTNLGLELVQRGQALVNQDGLVIPTKDDNNAALIDFNPTVKQLQKDSTFISQLEEAEFAAWKLREGVWSSTQMRALRKEYAEEEAYLNSSLWSKLKRGFSWIIGASRK